MMSMFNGCSGLTELDVTTFNTSEVTDMRSMFYDCSGLTELDLSNFDTSQVTTMGTINTYSLDGMFGNCSKLTELDLSSFDTSNVTDMNEMFKNCSTLTTIYVSEYDETTGKGWTTSAVTDSYDMFWGCTKLVGQNGTAYSISYRDKTYARIDKSGQPGYLSNIAVSPSQIFDAEGTNTDGLHIGDFVNYDAGTWTQEEINAIQTGLKTSLVTANNSTSLPTQAFQFGGFTAGSSRNGNATPYGDLYLKDAETGEAITGWRVFDVEGDTVTLISAGNPEDYYHPYGTNYGYISEYILTGNINSSWSNGATEAENYQKRNWDMYVNTSQYGESAGVLTKAMLDEWYTKYTNTPNADTWTDATFRKIYQEPYIKYQNMVENYSYYWLSSARYSYGVYSVNPSGRGVTFSRNNAYGVRAVVSLKSNVQFTATKAGTKTVTGGNTTTYGGDQTYNVWNIK